MFERFFYLLDDLGPDAFGVAVFDELEKVQSHILVSQMDSYFKDAAQQTPQPEIHVKPDRLVSYDHVAEVLADAQRLGVTHIGFTGIDQYN